MDEYTSIQLLEELQRRMYAIPVEVLAKYLEAFEQEYINRMAANCGYVDCEAQLV